MTGQDVNETTAVAPALSFEQRLRNRLRENIGDVMTDEDLKGLVERGLDDLLFKERIVRPGTWNQPEVKEPPLLQEMLLKELRPQLETAVRDWLEEHSDEVMEAFEKKMQDGLGAAMLEAFGAIFDRALIPVREQMYQLTNGQQ